MGAPASGKPRQENVTDGYVVKDTASARSINAGSKSGKGYYHVKDGYFNCWIGMLRSVHST